LPETGLTLTGSVFSLTSPVAVANGGTGLTSLGSGVATFLGTPSSENLAAAVDRRGAILEHGELGCGGFGVTEELADLRGEVGELGILGGIERGKGFVPVLWLRDHIATQ
jgi:hypothetical protein